MISVSAPCRVDIGGTWDMKMFSLPYRRIDPVTITIALSQRVHVDILPYNIGKIMIEDTETFEQDSEGMAFDGRYGLINAILSYYQADGIRLRIKKDYPYQSGLGGSGGLAVSVIAALNQINNDDIVANEIIDLAHEIEDGMRFSYTGYQDQCAAVYGGVKIWHWNNRYRHENLLCQIDAESLESRLVIAYVGESHNGNEVNELQVESFLGCGSDRKSWLDINDNTKKCAEAIRNQDWTKVSDCVSIEHDIRTRLVPERLSPKMYNYEKLAGNVGKGFGICGSGGCVFYLGETPENASTVRQLWEDREFAQIIDSKLDFHGIKL